MTTPGNDAGNTQGSGGAGTGTGSGGASTGPGRATALTSRQREDNYRRQNGTARLTPRQARRVIHKFNRAFARGE